MLIKFEVENWLSFRERICFTMLSTRERQHGERIARLPRYGTVKVLPIAAIYGGNASGKTNFFKAIHFVRELVLKSSRPEVPIGVQPFRLEAEAANKPSSFLIQVLANEVIYEFSFVVTATSVIEEKLVSLGRTADKVLYHRKDGQIKLASSLPDQDFLTFAFNGTQDNQLFLTNSVQQKGRQFQPVYSWFRNNLRLIAPDSRFAAFDLFIEKGSFINENVNKLLPALDTGIDRLGGEEIPFANLAIPDELRDDIRKETPDGGVIKLRIEPQNDCYLVRRNGNDFKARKLVTFHNMNDGGEEKFDMVNESDGSQRVIDLLPAFLAVSDRAAQKVFIIDELDRSLHTLLTRQLLEAYLAECGADSRAQVLFTTHDLLLMDQSLLRRDEMWLVERDRQGASSLIPLSDFNSDIRYDKDIRKSYLQGRMGGMPKIHPMLSFQAVDKD